MQPWGTGLNTQRSTLRTQHLAPTWSLVTSSCKNMMPIQTTIAFLMVPRTCASMIILLHYFYISLIQFYFRFSAPPSLGLSQCYCVSARPFQKSFNRHRAEAILKELIIESDTAKSYDNKSALMLPHDSPAHAAITADRELFLNELLLVFYLLSYTSMHAINHCCMENATPTCINTLHSPWSRSCRARPNCTPVLKPHNCQACWQRYHADTFHGCFATHHPHPPEN